ncbi:hypothetical protein ACFX13_036143 [Malus domestica]|uniref:VOC domain-containing protein n=1 Tax=Malus baccata TaxID=106549 RepID=A0A540NMT7_MALBA|nr:uncharacterized protein At5g48480-like [Malus sylvestris]TQE12335.1 hypothetical protein C1H46_001988 [Malus baccata]
MAEQKVQNGEAAEKVAPVSLITVTECHPRLSIKAPNAEDAIKFYVAVLGAVELERETDLKRKADQERPYIYNAKLKLGSLTFLVTESASVVDSGDGEVLADGGFKQGVNLLLTVADVDAAVSKVVQAGAAAVGEIKTGGAFFGDEQRWAQIKDPFGICWFFVTPVEKKAAVPEAPVTV